MPYSSDISDSSKIPDMLLTAKEVADYLSISVEALAQDRFRGDGIPFVKIGSRVRYRLSSLLAYLEEKEQRQSQPPTAPVNRPASTHKMRRV